jgi:hypothetical protein
MATKTKTKPVINAANVNDVVSQIAADREDLLEAAEAILAGRGDLPSSTWHLAKTFPPTERAVFQMLGWTDRDIAREWGRVSSVDKQKQRAGTIADRKEAAKKASAATEALRTRGKLIREEMATLQAELTQLEESHAEAVREREKQEAALTQLRGLAPMRVTEVVDDRRRVASKELGVGVSEMESRAQTIQGVMAIDIRDKAGMGEAVLHARSVKDDLIVYDRDHAGHVRGWVVDDARWGEYVAKLAAELDELEPRLSQAKEAYAAALADAETPMDEWIAAVTG